MISQPTFFKDVLLIKPVKYSDKRGSFSEYFSKRDLEKIIGRNINLCQDNLTHSKKGVLRGLHYQLPPTAQSKLVSVILGTVLDVVLDVRKGSPTFGQYMSQELSAENQFQLFIPRGFAHGFITLRETSIFQYKVDNYYHPENEGSVAPNDPVLAIDWKLPEESWIQSEKDLKHPSLMDATVFDFMEDLYA